VIEIEVEFRRLPMESIYVKWGKRTFDVALSFIALVVSLPVFALVACAIKLDSPGPVFFKQKRMGQGGIPFTIIKFRTMFAGVGETGGLVKTREDPRITKVGKFLRATHLDEMPQVVNVLRGEMSIVGPRPEAWESAEILMRKIPGWDSCIRVKPGITGLTQVYVGRETVLELGDSLVRQREAASNGWYVGHLGLLADIRIIAMTVPHCLMRHGV